MKELLNNQEIVRRISDHLGLGESQLKKYMRLFDAVDWELEKARAELGKYKSVNQWDELRSKGELQLSSKEHVQKKPEHFEQDRKNGRNKVPLPANHLYAMKPTTRFIAKVTKVHNALTDLSNHFVFLTQQKDLSKQGVKRLKSIQNDLSKSKQALNEFLNVAEQKREVTE
jgi:predicted ribosome quality control (RQC) complex YloA/Tae2 family protein